jgi:predicted dehydrogenase
MDDFRAVAQFVDKYPNVIEPTELDNVKREFLHFASDYSVGWDDDPDWLRYVAADLEFVGTKLAIDVKGFTEPLYKEAEQIETNRAEHEREEEDRDAWEPASYHDDVDAMFASLREDIEG